MKNHVTAPAPRFLLRLFVVNALLRRRHRCRPNWRRIGEIGPGLGDMASYTAAELDPESFSLHESSDEAHAALVRRFGDDPRFRLSREFVPSNGTYDLLLCFEVVEHVEDDIGFLVSIASSLKAGGTLIGSVPAHPSKWQAVDELAGHFRRYSVNDMREALLAAGFVDIEIETYGFPLINLLYPLRHLYYSRALRSHLGDTKAEATARSGTARGFSRAFNTSLVYGLVRCFDLFRHLPATANLDDGMVFVCRRR